MKKLTALIASVIMVAVCITGCGVNPAATQQKVKLSSELSDLKDSMEKEGYIDKDAVETGMTPAEQKNTEGKKKEYGGYLLIGAEEGVRYSFQYNESSVNVELYRYDKLNDTAKKIISDVKSKGEFVLAEENEAIPAYLSKNEKFLMIYQDSSSEKKNKNKMKEAIEYFENYGAKDDGKDNKKETKAEEPTAPETTEK